MLDSIRQTITNHEPTELETQHRDRAQAAVLIPIVRGDRILLTERAGSLAHHGGEVAFPGGRRDHDDPSLIFTALRETEEELGITPSAVEVLGSLRPFISKYGLAVTPIVGVVDHEADIVASPDEIASVFEVPLSYFRDEEPDRIDVISRHGETHHVRVHIYEGYEVWGLTAMIIHHFLHVLG